MFRVVIPARMGSARLPGKPLLLLAGKSLLERVHEVALASGAAQVCIATDDERVRSVAAGFGVAAQLTSPAHASGTDRIAEVAMRCGWPATDVIVNLPVDGPLTAPQLPAQVARLLQEHPEADIATLATPIREVDELLDPHVVKVVADLAGRALYFSRAPVPWSRDTAPSGVASQGSCQGARRHIGLYAYRVAALLRLSKLPPSPLERLEKLEQLRALEHGMQIRVADALRPPGPDINTPQDLQRAERMLKASTEPAT